MLHLVCTSSVFSLQHSPCKVLSYFNWVFFVLFSFSLKLKFQIDLGVWMFFFFFYLGLLLMLNYLEVPIISTVVFSILVEWLCFSCSTLDCQKLFRFRFLCIFSRAVINLVFFPGVHGSAIHCVTVSFTFFLLPLLGILSWEQTMQKLGFRFTYSFVFVLSCLIKHLFLSSSDPINRRRQFTLLP